MEDIWRGAWSGGYEVGGGDMEDIWRGACRPRGGMECGNLKLMT